jgi:hypothetical protein
MRSGNKCYPSIPTHGDTNNNLAKIRTPVLAVPICYYYRWIFLVFIDSMLGRATVDTEMNPPDEACPENRGGITLIAIGTGLQFHRNSLFLTP